MQMNRNMGFSSFFLTVAMACVVVRGTTAQTNEPASFTFDCDRLTLAVPCQNNGTCQKDTGACQCVDGYDGDDCSYLSDDVVEVDRCEKDCYKRGICVIDDHNVTSCVCDGAYHGNSCKHKRVHHKCSHDAMTMFVTPPGDFDGSVYVLDQEADPECIFDKDPENSFNKKIKLDACGSTLEETDENGDTKKSFRVLVQFDRVFVTEKDLEFEFVCKVLKSGSDINNHLDAFKHQKKERPFLKQEVTEELNPVTMTLTTEDGQPISGPQELGQVLKLTFTLNGGDAYDRFFIDNIIATNGQEEPFREEQALVSNGCVPENARMVTHFGGDATAELTLTFKVFKLRYSDMLQFETNLRMCFGAGCDPVDCTTDILADPEFPGLGRRRRDVSDVTRITSHPVEHKEDKHVLWTQVLVVYPAQSNQSMTAKVATLPADMYSVRMSRETLIGCLDNTGFLLLMSGLVALVIILAITTVTLAARSCNSPFHRDAEIPKYSK